MVWRSFGPGFSFSNISFAKLFFFFYKRDPISDAAFVDNATFKERLLSMGAGLIFVVSDLTLAVDKFVNPLANAKFYVLSTYFLAQFCFVKWAVCKAERTGPRKTE